MLRARESYNVWKFRTDKRIGVLDIEHGLYPDPGKHQETSLAENVLLSKRQQ